MSMPILVAVTPSDHDRGALDVAVVMARVMHLPLVLGAVAVPADVVPSSAMVGWVAEAVEPGFLARAAADQLSQMAACVPEDVAVTTATTIAQNIAVGIEELAATHGASLIVLGPTHRTLLSRVVDEDPTLGLIRHARCPVLVASGEAGSRTPPAPPKRIAVAWDRSVEAHQALVYAAGLARRAGALLDVVHVLESPAPLGLPSLEPGIDHVRHADRVAAVEDEIRVALLAVGVDAADISVREGQLGPELAQASAKADVLVIGSRRRGPVRRVVAGSASAYMAHHGCCPVLVTPRELPAPVSA